MKSLFINELTASFMMFLDHQVCYKASAFFNLVDEKLFPSTDPNFSGRTIYQSRYKQWISDNALVSIGGTIPTQIKDGSSIITKSTNDLKFDYNMESTIKTMLITRPCVFMNKNYRKQVVEYIEKHRTK